MTLVVKKGCRECPYKSLNTKRRDERSGVVRRLKVLTSDEQLWRFDATCSPW
jgi:hypothetical protein